MTSTPMLPSFAAPTDTERASLAAILNDTGLRATVPRINVLHYLNTTDIPVTAEMISRFVDLPLSTAYRALTALEVNSLAGVTFGRSDVTRWFRFLPDTPQHCPACGQSLYGEYA
ncbi:TPA: helix-turn-helix domain-containing protein [Klebsiella pneumoniae]